MMLLGFNNVIVFVSSLLIFIAKSYCYVVWRDHSLFIHQTHIGVSAVVYSVHRAAMSIQIQVLIWKYSFTSHESVRRSGMAGTYDKCSFNLGTASFAKAATLNSPEPLMGVLCAPRPHQHVEFSIFFIFNSNRCIILSHCSFYSHFP